MRRLIVFIGIIILILSGCTGRTVNESSSVDYNSDKVAEPGRASYTGIVLKKNSYRGVVLYDYEKRKIIDEYSGSKGETVLSYGEIEGGYYTVFANRKKSDSLETEKRSVKDTDVNVSAYSTDTGDIRVVLFDSEFHVKKKLSLYDTIKKLDDPDTVLSSNKAIVSPDGKVIAFDITFGIFYIDMTNQKYGYLSSFKRKKISIEYLTFTDNSHIAFTGGIVDNQEDSVIGFVDMNDNISYRIVKNYQNDGIFNASNTIWMTEWENPETRSSSGWIYTMHVPDGKLKKIKLDGLESTLASFNEDGSQVIGVRYMNENSFRIRTYRVSDMKILSEKKLAVKDGVKPYSIVRHNGKAIVIFTDDKGDGAVYAS